MVAIPYFFNEIERILSNTPSYALLLEALLLASVVWLVLYKRSGRRKYSEEEEESIIAAYDPDPLVPETDSNHSLLQRRLLQSKIGKYITVGGNKCLNLATHNYLGLADDDIILEDACETVKKYGVGSCGPRGFYGTMDVHLNLEERLARFMQMEEAIVYSYGFSTVASAIPAYSKRGDVIFLDEMVNFAIQKGLDASRSTIYFFKHNDMKDLERLLLEQEKRDLKNQKKAAKTRRFLIAEGIYMNTGEICPLPDLIKFRAKYKLRLFLDESVSLGVLGEKGRGVTEYFNIDVNEVDLIVASMEHAISTIGGFCVGSHFIVEHQRLSGLGYCFSASLPPLLATAAISALIRFESQPNMFDELREASRRLHAKFVQLEKFELRGNELSPVKHLYIADNVPNDLTEEQKLLRQISDQCIACGVAIVEASYLFHIEKKTPRPSIRITANRLLTDEDIETAFEQIQAVAKEIL